MTEQMAEQFPQSISGYTGTFFRYGGPGTCLTFEHEARNFYWESRGIWIRSFTPPTEGSLIDSSTWKAVLDPLLRTVHQWSPSMRVEKLIDPARRLVFHTLVANKMRGYMTVLQNPQGRGFFLILVDKACESPPGSNVRQWLEDNGLEYVMGEVLTPSTLQGGTVTDVATIIEESKIKLVPQEIVYDEMNQFVGKRMTLDDLQKTPGVLAIYPGTQSGQRVYAVICDSPLLCKSLRTFANDGAEIFWHYCWGSRHIRDERLAHPADVWMSLPDRKFVWDAISSPEILRLFEQHSNLRAASFYVDRNFNVVLRLGVTAPGIIPASENKLPKSLEVLGRVIVVHVRSAWVEFTAPENRFTTNRPVVAGSAIGKAGERGFRTLGGMVSGKLVTAGHGLAADQELSQSCPEAIERAFQRSQGIDPHSCTEGEFRAWEAARRTTGQETTTFEAWLRSQIPMGACGHVERVACGNVRCGGHFLGADVALMNSQLEYDTMHFAESTPPGFTALETTVFDLSSAVTPDTLMSCDPLSVWMFGATSGYRKGYFVDHSQGTPWVIKEFQSGNVLTLLPVFARRSTDPTLGVDGDSGALVFTDDQRLLGLHSAIGAYGGFASVSLVSLACAWKGLWPGL